MAASDYRSCDICGSKTFYDASLNWHEPDDDHHAGFWLPGLGDWAVICKQCAKTYETVVRHRDTKTVVNE